MKNTFFFCLFYPSFTSFIVWNIQCDLSNCLRDQIICIEIDVISSFETLIRWIEETSKYCNKPALVRLSRLGKVPGRRHISMRKRLAVVSGSGRHRAVAGCHLAGG